MDVSILDIQYIDEDEALEDLSVVEQEWGTEWWRPAKISQDKLR